MSWLWLSLSPADQLISLSRFGTSAFHWRLFASIGSVYQIGFIIGTTWLKKVGLDWIGATYANQLLNQLIIFFMSAASLDWLQLTLDPLLPFHFFGGRLTLFLMSLPGSAKGTIWSIFLFFYHGKSGWQGTNVYLKTNNLIFFMLFSPSRINFNSILLLPSRKVKGELLDRHLLLIFLLVSLMGHQQIIWEVLVYIYCSARTTISSLNWVLEWVLIQDLSFWIYGHSFTVLKSWAFPLYISLEIHLLSLTGSIEDQLLLYSLLMAGVILLGSWNHTSSS